MSRQVQEKQSNFIPTGRPVSNAGDSRQDMTQHLTMVDRDLQHIFTYINSLPQYATVSTAVPTSTPIRIGDMFINETTNKVYVSCGTSSSTDWRILN
jgi:hypothetical protein